MGTLTHQAVAFTDHDELVGVVASVAGKALRRGDPVLTALPDDLAERVRERIGSGADRLDALSFHSCYDSAPRTLARFVDAVRGYVADGRRPTIVGGSMLVRREPSEVVAWMQIEAVINDALAHADAHLLCCFPRVGLEPWAGEAVWSTHPTVVLDAQVRPSPGYVAPPRFLAAHPEPAGPPLGEPVATLPFDLASLRDVRRLVADHAVRASVTATAADDLAIAVNEAVTNSVEHGPGHGTLRIWAAPRELTCEVHDHGRLSAPYLGLLPPAPTSPRGRGLWLIRQLTDARFRIEDTGSTVRMTVRG